MIDFNALIKEKDLLKEIANPKNRQIHEELSETLQPLNEVITKIAVTGNASAFEWGQIKTLFLYKIKETILKMQSEYSDFHDKPGDTFEIQLESILTSFLAFEDK